MMAEERRSPSTGRRLIRSYGLIALIAIGFLLMALLIREKEHVVPAQGAPVQPPTLISL